MTTVQPHSYLQPHEGVVGTDRPGDPLLETEAASTVAARLVRRLYSASLGPTPANRELFVAMTTPSPGAPVVVIDSTYMRDPVTRFQGVGYLILTRAEWWTTDEVWEQDKAEDGLVDEDRMVEPEAHYIQYGPAAADICRWVNCQVLTIPIEIP